MQLVIRMRDTLRISRHITDYNDHIADRLQELAAQCGFDLRESEDQTRFEEAFMFAEAEFNAGADVSDPSVSKTGDQFRQGLAAVLSRHARR